MRTRLPLAAQRLLLVTGKGGVGKTSVAAALARATAGSRRRVLAVEVGRGGLGSLLGGGRLGSEPALVAPGLLAATIEPEEALADFIHGVLRFKTLSRRLLESTSFQVLAAAAPGLPEFLVLQRLLGWIEARRLTRPVYDLVIVDAPASGHSLPLLSAPRTLGTLARIGPVATILGKIDALLRDPARTLVCIVTTPEELAVRETIDLHRELRDRLGLPVAPVIVNAVPPRRFTAPDVEALADLDGETDPYVFAARFQLARRRQASAQVGALRRALRAAPVPLPFLFGGPEGPGGIARLAAELAAAAGLAGAARPA